MCVKFWIQIIYFPYACTSLFTEGKIRKIGGGAHWENPRYATGATLDLVRMSELDVLLSVLDTAYAQKPYAYWDAS